MLIFCNRAETNTSDIRIFVRFAIQDFAKILQMKATSGSAGHVI